MRSSVRFRVVDVVAITAVTGVVASVFGAAAVSKQEIAGRIKCASNLKQLGIAIELYAKENRGAFPRTPFKVDAPPTWGTPYGPDNKAAGPSQECDPFATEGDKYNPPAAAALANRPKPNDVTAAMFLLLRTEDLVPENFLCPGTLLKRWDYANEDAKRGENYGALDYTNFYGTKGVAEHLSYSYQNPYASPDAISAGFKLNNSIAPDFVVMSDMNPGNKALLNARPDDAPKPRANLTAEQRALNSLNHLGDGQNVLFGDGHVEFVNTPFVGQQRDNIFVSGDAGEARKEGKPAFAASPVDAIDNILLPTAADIGQKPGSSDLDMPTEADVKSIQAKYAGTYARQSNGHESVLKIDERNLTMTFDGGEATTLAYQILGQRSRSVVLEVSDGKRTYPMELHLEDDGLHVESDDFPLGTLKKRLAP